MTLADAPSAPPAADGHYEVAGVRVPDPYRFLELPSADHERWFRAESAFAAHVLRARPEWRGFRDRIAELGGAFTYVAACDVRGPLAAVVRRGAGGWVVAVRRGDAGESIAFDEASDPMGRRVVPSSLALSPDGRRLAIGTTGRGDSGAGALVYDVDEEALHATPIRGITRSDAEGFRLAWNETSTALLYVRRSPALPPPEPGEELMGNQLTEHVVGTDGAADRALFGFGITQGIDPADTIVPHSGGRHTVVTVRKPQGREVWAMSPRALGQEAAFRRIHRSDAPLRGLAVAGDRLLLAVADRSANGEVIAYDLVDPAGVATVVLSSSDAPVRDIAATDEALLVIRSTPGGADLLRVREGMAEKVPLPERRHVFGLCSDGRRALFGTSSWLSPDAWFSLEKEVLSPVDLGVQFTTRVPAATVTTEWVRARDGVAVPVSLLRREPSGPGPAPVLVQVYGCFGESLDPFFVPELAAWIERGGVVAFAHVRGGGELGWRWHRAATGERRRVAFDDLVDVGEHLVHGGYARPGGLAVEGRSCGGLNAANAALDRPDLFGAVVLRVAVLDLPGTLRTSAGARSIRDTADPGTAAGVQRIVELSPYHRVLAGAAPSSLLAISASDDYAIPMWQAGKMISALRAAGRDDASVLWTTRWDEGHLGHGPDDLADELTFLWWRLQPGERDAVAGETR